MSLMGNMISDTHVDSLGVTIKRKKRPRPREQGQGENLHDYEKQGKWLLEDFNMEDLPVGTQHFLKSIQHINKCYSWPRTARKRSLALSPPMIVDDIFDAYKRHVARVAAKKKLPAPPPKILRRSDVQYVLDDSGHPIVVGLGSYGILLKGQLKANNEKVVFKLICCNTKMNFDGLLAQILNEVSIQTFVQQQTSLAPKIYGLIILKEEPGIFDIGIVQEYVTTVPGIDLSVTLAQAALAEEEVKKSGRMPLITLEHWIRILARLVVAAARLVIISVIHCDLKANNVLLRYKDGELHPVLIDFGLAMYKQVRCSETLSPKSHRDKLSMIRNQPYIAPEMVLTGEATSSSDLFSIGMGTILYIAEIFNNAKLQNLRVKMTYDFRRRISHEKALKILRKIEQNPVKLSLKERLKNLFSIWQ